MCAAYYISESRWYRGQILAKKNYSYYISLIDFGEKIELSFENVRKLNKE